MEVASVELVDSVAMLGRATPSKDVAPTGPAGRRAYAVGDVHGRLDLLDELLRDIETDNSARAPARVTIVFLGDLIDRGPQSGTVCLTPRQSPVLKLAGDLVALALAVCPA